MSGVFIVAIMSYVESIAIAKGFGRKNNYKVDPGQELIALGTANVISSFFSSYPVTGSFSRTAVNAQSGVMTPAGGIITGILVLIATQFLTPLFEFIPASALAAVIMLAAISMFDTDGVKHAWAVNKMDVIPLALTFFVCFYEIAVSYLNDIQFLNDLFLFEKSISFGCKISKLSIFVRLFWQIYSFFISISYGP